MRVTCCSSVYFTPGQTYTYILSSPSDLGTVRNVAFRWDHDTNLLDVGTWNLLWLRHPKLYVDRITVASGESHNT